MMKERIEELLAQIDGLKCKNAKEVEEARVKLLGKKGEITGLFDEFRTFSPDLKKEFGRKINELKQAALAKIDARDPVQPRFPPSCFDSPPGDRGHIPEIRLRRRRRAGDRG